MPGRRDLAGGCDETLSSSAVQMPEELYETLISLATRMEEASLRYSRRCRCRGDGCRRCAERAPVPATPTRRCTGAWRRPARIRDRIGQTQHVPRWATGRQFDTWWPLHV